jgi:hypothetical protein
MKAAGAGAGALAVGGTLVGSASAAIGDSYYQVDLIETTNDSVVTPLDSTGYSGRGNLIDWKWGDAAGNTAEGAMNKTSYDGDLACTVDGTSNFTFDTANATASVDVSIGSCAGSIGLTLVCYAAPDDAGLGWDPTQASNQVEFSKTEQTEVSSDTTISTDIPARDIDEGLIGYWSFEGDNIAPASPTVYDASGNGFHGTENEGGSGSIDYTSNPSGLTAGPSATFERSNNETLQISNPG